ncbi:MAG: hypothetical protein L3K02_07360 [Thermoplasmata archaeon]|nr:hypothetical protein [Thermoplasmata archaeon]
MASRAPGRRVGVVAGAILLVLVLSAILPGSSPYRAPSVPNHALGSAARTALPVPPSSTVRSHPASDPPLAWVNLTSGSPSTPPCGGDQALAYDPLLWEFVSFGGVIPCTGPGFAGGSTWTFTNGTWANISATLLTAPSPRYGMAMAFDAADGYILAFGGATSTGVPFDETWTFNGTWSDITSAQTVSPPAVFNAGVTYDGTTHSVLLLDGFGNAGNENGTWSFSGGQWSQVAAATLPPALHSPGMLYDPTTSSVLLFGGVNSFSTILGETWSFASGTWTQLFPSTSPPSVFDETAFYDGADGAPILFGGYTALPGVYSPIGGTWSFSNGNWSNISSSILGTPSPRSSARAAFDPQENWTLVFGGRGSSLSLLDDTWAFPGVAFWSARLTTSRPSVDQGFPVNLTTSLSGGGGPYTFQYSGLPPGCGTANLTAITCTPTAHGSFSVTVTVTNAAAQTRNATAVLVVNPPLSISVKASVSTLDLGQNVTYLATTTGGGGGEVYIYTEAPGGPAFPSGCLERGASMKCIPNATGVFAVVADTEDSVGGSASSAPVPLTVLPGLSISLTASARQVDLGQNVTFNVSVGGGSGVFAVVYTGLPLGCSSANTTSLNCLPDGVGNYSVVAHVTDTLGGAQISSARSVTISPTLLASFPGNELTGVVGESLFLNASVSGGSPPVTYVWSGLPAGCTATGVKLDCIPGAAGIYAIDLVVNDAAGANVTLSAEATVLTAASPSPGGTNFFADPLVWVAIVVVVVVVGIVGALSLLRRSPPPSTAAAPPSPPPPVPEETGWVVRRSPPS